ncbi:MAG: DUF3137 domain-containing protein, partial [Clostridia bacterium]
MDKEFKAKLDALEKERLAVLKRKTLATAITVPILAVLCLLGIFTLGVHPLFTVVGAIFLYMFIVEYIIGGSVRKFKRFYKTEFVKTSFATAFDNVNYNPTSCISEDAVRSSSLVRLGNRYSGNDYLSGSYKGVNFVHSDLLIQQVTNSGKTTHTATLFEGKWLIFDFNKTINEYLSIREREFLKKINFFSSDSVVEFESVDFNNEFEVKCTNQHTAFYVLTPHFIEAIREINSKTQGQLLMCFVNGKMHVALNDGRDSLEPSIRTSVYDYQN